MTDRRIKLGFKLGLAVACLAFALAGLSRCETCSSGQNDFAPLYVAAQRAGQADLYSDKPYHDFQREHWGEVLFDGLLFSRLPFYAALLKPLGSLDYETAHLAWVLIRVAAVIGFILLWPGSKLETVFVAAISLPLFVALFNGQDTPLLLLFVAAAVRWRDSRPAWAGVALSLCAIKFHLFLLLPILLIRHRRWRIIQGFLGGALVLLAISFTVGGWSWPLDYYGMLTDQRIHPFEEFMPNLHGIFVAHPWLEVLAGAVYLSAAVVGFWRLGFTGGFALMLIGGVVLSRHAFLSDFTLLTPALLLLGGDDVVSWARGLAFLLVSPLALLLTEHPYTDLIQSALLVLFCAVSSLSRDRP